MSIARQLHGFVFVVFLVVCASVSAQTVVSVSGNVSDGNGGPFLSGTVYDASGLTVPAGQTLTIQAGAIVKLRLATQVTVDGTLVCNGTAADPVVFTAFSDDSYGGDTNGDGPSVGTPGYWFRLLLQPNSDASQFSNTIIRFSGRSGFSCVDLSGSDITMTDCLIEKGGGSIALDVNNTSNPTVSGCAFNECGRPIVGVPFPNVSNFTNNTATGNSVHNVMEVSSTVLVNSMTVTTANLVNGILFAPAGLVVSPAGHLTLTAGVVIKIGLATSVDIDGTLTATGTSGAPIVLTSFEDDAFGGDSNNNGPSSGTPGSWFRLDFGGGSDASTLAHVRVRYAGRSGFPCVDLNQADISMNHCSVEHGAGVALHLRTLSRPTVHNCNFDFCHLPVTDATLEALTAFSNNTATGNSIGDYIRTLSNAVGSNIQITTQNMIGSALYLVSGLSVTAGASLTLGPGVIFKFGLATQLTVDGTLIAQGTTSDPVVFTAFTDDAHGGDTNNDGPSVGTPGYWFRLHFRAFSDASTLDFSVVRFAGRSGFNCVDLMEADITMRNCLIEKGTGDGLGAALSHPTVLGCGFDECQTAIDNVSLAALQNFRDITAVGNSIGNYACVEPGVAPTETVTLFPWNYPNGAIYAPSGISVNGSLTLQPGVVVKVGLATSLATAPSSTLNVRGSGLEPVVVTSFTDDEYGGDTNNDGPSSGVPGTWFRVYCTANGSLEHMLVRYAGRSSFASVQCTSPSTSLHAVRVEHCNGDCFTINALAGSLTNCVAWNGTLRGFEINTAGVDVIHCTAVGCNDDAFFRTPSAMTGSLWNCISWGNGGDDFDGYSLSDVHHSNGDPAYAGMNGNISADPQFVDGANGDFYLSDTSPCLNAAATAPAGQTIFVDIDEGSRWSDSQLVGASSVLPDMGAYEAKTFGLSVTGEPRLDRDITLNTTTSGPTNGVAVYAAGALLTGPQWQMEYGWFTVGTETTSLLLATLPVGFPLTATVPSNPSIVGFEFGIQAVCVLGSNTSIGNFTERYRAVITP